MKIGYVLLDGCADRPVPELNFTTPLEAAYTPNLDRIASGSKLGSVTTVGKGIAPESDIAVFNMLGYAFGKGYPGRGVVEAVGAGLKVNDGDLALRANFAAVQGPRILDRRAGRNLSQDEAEELAKEVNGIKLEGAELQFKATVGYRGVLVIRGSSNLSASVSNTDPAYARLGGFGAAKKTSNNDKVMKCVPETKDAAAVEAARLVNEFTAKSARVLSSSPVNGRRKKEGKLAANGILLRDAGDHLPRLEPFEDKYGMKGIALVEMPAEVGIAKLLGMRMVPIEDRKDIKEKASKFSSALADDSVVYVHIKGPDEFGHDGDAMGKKKNIEAIDRDFFSACLPTMADAKLAVSCDHATPCTLKMHSADPVPLLVTDKAGDKKRFTEDNSRSGSLGRLRGSEVLALVAHGVRRRASSAA